MNIQNLKTSNLRNLCDLEKRILFSSVAVWDY